MLSNVVTLELCCTISYSNDLSFITLSKKITLDRLNMNKIDFNALKTYAFALDDNQCNVRIFLLLNLNFNSAKIAYILRLMHICCQTDAFNWCIRWVLVFVFISVWGTQCSTFMSFCSWPWRLTNMLNGLIMGKRTKTQTGWK